MKQFFTVLVLIGWGLLFVPLYYAFGYDESYEVTNALALSLCLGVAVGFSEGLCEALAHFPRLSSSDALVLGVFITSLSLAVIFGGLWVARVARTPEWAAYWRDHIAFGIARWMLVLGVGFLMLSSRSVDGRIPSQTYLLTGLAVAVGVMAVGLAVSFGFA